MEYFAGMRFKRFDREFRSKKGSLTDALSIAEVGAGQSYFDVSVYAVTEKIVVRIPYRVLCSLSDEDSKRALIEERVARKQS